MSRSRSRIVQHIYRSLFHCNMRYGRSNPSGDRCYRGTNSIHPGCSTERGTRRPPSADRPLPTEIDRYHLRSRIRGASWSCISHGPYLGRGDS